MAQITIRAYTPSHLMISTTTTTHIFPRLAILSLSRPNLCPNLSPSLSTKPPHLSLMVPKVVATPLINETTTNFIEEEEEEIKQDRNEETERVWKYPFTNIEVKKRRPLFGSGRDPWTARDIVKASVGVALHALCLFAPFTFTWSAFAVMMTLIVFTGLGITLSFHRNLTHRSFRLPKWLEYFWAYCGAHALQGSPMTWVSIHRTHHLHTDKEGDPHSPIEGFWFSQINWIFDTKYFNDKQGGALTNVGDMDKQPFYNFIEDTYIAHPIALAALLYAIGGFPWLVWGMGVRAIITTHTTYLVNSGLHIWGSRAYNIDDNSHNNWIMAFLTFGEGWHNNHHAFEFSARHGFEWYQIDFTWYVIKFLDALGLVKDIKLPTDAQKKKMLELWN